MESNHNSTFEKFDAQRFMGRTPEIKKKKVEKSGDEKIMATIDLSSTVKWIKETSLDNILQICVSREKQSFPNPVYDHPHIKKCIGARILETSKEPQKDGGTPLHAFVKNRKIDFVKYILHVDSIDKNAFDSKNKTALHYALEDKIDLDLVKLLISGGCDINVAFTDSNDLFNKNVVKDYMCVKYLVEDIKYDINCYVPQFTYVHPLITAAECDSKESFDLFLNQMDAKCTFFRQLCISGGTDHINFAHYFYFTKKEWIISNLLQKYPKDNLPVPESDDSNFRYSSFYEFLMRRGGSKFTEELLKRGDSLDNFNSIGMYPIHIAAKNGDAHIMHLIGKYKKNQTNFDPNVRTKDVSKFTPLYLAVNKCDYETCEELISMGAKTNSIIKGTSILHLAVLNNSVDICKLLLQNGANPNKKDANGAIPFDYALKFKNNEIINAFRYIFHAKSSEERRGSQNDLHVDVDQLTGKMTFSKSK